MLPTGLSLKHKHRTLYSSETYVYDKKELNLNYALSKWVET